MSGRSVSTDSIDYLQRCLLPPTEPAGPRTAAAPHTRRLLRVRGIGRPDKDGRRRAAAPEEVWRPPTTGLITGLYGHRIPLAFLLRGSGQGVEVQLGTWSARESTGGDAQDRRRDVVASVLHGLYSSVAV